MEGNSGAFAWSLQVRSPEKLSSCLSLFLFPVQGSGNRLQFMGADLTIFRKAKGQLVIEV